MYSSRSVRQNVSRKVALHPIKVDQRLHNFAECTSLVDALRTSESAGAADALARVRAFLPVATGAVAAVAATLPNHAGTP